MRLNIPRQYRRRWQLAWWGVNGCGIGIATTCVWFVPSWWMVFAMFALYVTGFLAAVLVEIGTQ